MPQSVGFCVADVGDEERRSRCLGSCEGIALFNGKGEPPCCRVGRLTAWEFCLLHLNPAIAILTIAGILRISSLQLRQAVFQTQTGKEGRSVAGDSDIRQNFSDRNESEGIGSGTFASCRGRRFIFGGFRGSSARITGHPRTLYRPQIMNWAGFATLQEAKEVYQATSHPEVIARAFLSEVKKLKETDPKASGSFTQSGIVIRTRSIQKANPGDLATYRWGSLESFSDGRLFAPSTDLLRAYKNGAISWEEYEEAYCQEMRELFKRSPEAFLDLLKNRREFTLVCYEADPGRCHRRILAEVFEKIGSANGIHVILDIK